MTRVVIDTSVWIHYLIRSGSAVRQILEEGWLSGEVIVVAAPQLFFELEAVLARPAIRAVIPEEAGRLLLEVIGGRVEMLPPLGEVPEFTRDRKDDRFVACAVVGNAEYLISLDKDILVLGELGRLKMVTPVGFLDAGCMPAVGGAPPVGAPPRGRPYGGLHGGGGQARGPAPYEGG